MAPVARPLQAADRAAVLGVARSLREWFNEEGLAAMERDLASDRGLVLEEGGHLLGFALWRPVEDGAVDLAWMGVDPGLHRRGLGTLLLGSVLGDVRREGFTAVEVSTVADSCDYEPYERTRRFYRALGFRDHRLDRGFYGPPGDRYDRLVLRLPVRPGSSPGGTLPPEKR